MKKAFEMGSRSSKTLNLDLDKQVSASIQIQSYILVS